MHILLVTLHIHIPSAHSLKEKRKQIKSLKDKLSARFNASVSEVDKLDSWQQSVMGVCMLSNERKYLEKQISLIENIIYEYAEIELVSLEREWL